ncbi:MAG: alpha/beta hydrolase-fold protein [Gemmatimonadota bacterium]
MSTFVRFSKDADHCGRSSLGAAAHLEPSRRLALLLPLFIPAIAIAQSAPTRERTDIALSAASPIAIGETRRLVSRRLGEARELLIATPASYAKGSDRYPLLVLLDGSENFVTVVSAAHALATSGRIPEMIVVGVVNTHRDRDFTPALTQTRDEPPGISQMGGADSFEAFLADELLPSIDDAYRTQPLRILVGHSLGGLLAMHTLATRPALFRMYLTLEPSLWWDARSPVKGVLDMLRSTPALVARLVSVEGMSQEGWRPDWQALRAAAPAAVLTSLVSVDSETHQNLMYRGAYGGLLALFHDYPPVSNHDVSLATLAALETQYARVSRDFGYSVPIPLGVLLDLVDREQNQRRFAAAQHALARARELYPHSRTLPEWQTNLDSMIAGARRLHLEEQKSQIVYAPVTAAGARIVLGRWRSLPNASAPPANFEFRLAGDTLTRSLLVHGIASDGGDLRFPIALVEIHGRTIRFERENRGGGRTVTSLTLSPDGKLRGSDELVGGRPIPAGFVVPKTVLELERF